MSQIADNIQQVRETVAEACARVGRDPAQVTLVAVSKRQPKEAVLAAAEAGVQHFGENRVEEASEKIPTVRPYLPETITWHMIGNIQSRKVKQLLPLFQVVQSVDRPKIAEKLSELAQEVGVRVPVLLEVNLSGEESKHGFAVAGWQKNATIRSNFWEAVRSIAMLPNLELRGLMTMAPFYDDKERTRPTFAGMVELQEALRASMGLSL
ncbi:MAG: YggS family pyridoxal phosphate-dependent enzyme, partial [Anaerolineae bacterium]|nr:YggS family pyridoxal phosphate-dependent enzyme [Anaerolineae bacterium]